MLLDLVLDLVLDLTCDGGVGRLWVEMARQSTPDDCAEVRFAFPNRGFLGYLIFSGSF